MFLFSSSRRLLVRLPTARRPRERAWEIFNTRDFGFNEGGQNLSMWAASASFCAALLGFELYQSWLRIRARGDTCPACEAARLHYRRRVQGNDEAADVVRQELNKVTLQRVTGQLRE